MKFPTRSILAAGALAAAMLGTSSCSGATGTAAGQEPQAPVTVQTSFPGLAAATQEPTLPSLTQLRPRPGTVVQAAARLMAGSRLERRRWRAVRSRAP